MSRDKFAYRQQRLDCHIFNHDSQLAFLGSISVHVTKYVADVSFTFYIARKLTFYKNNIIYQPAYKNHLLIELCETLVLIIE